MIAEDQSILDTRMTRINVIQAAIDEGERLDAEAARAAGEGGSGQAEGERLDAEAARAAGEGGSG